MMTLYCYGYAYSFSNIPHQVINKIIFTSSIKIAPGVHPLANCNLLPCYLFVTLKLFELI
jgi:hypothetical protein